VQTPALRTIGNIVTGDDAQTQTVITAGALPALLSLLSSGKDAIRKEACWTISNITAGPATQIGSIIEANLIPPLIEILARGDFKTKKEACWALSNATAGGMQNPQIIQYLSLLLLELDLLLTKLTGIWYNKDASSHFAIS